jgi:hypothetical protein
MEALLGEPYRFILCSKMATLTEEMCKLPSCTSTKVLVISCLGALIETKIGQTDVKLGIERMMLMVGNLCHDIDRVQKGRMLIFISPCPPRSNVPDFNIHSKVAYVSTMILFSF